MKKFLLTQIILILLSISPLRAENYIITINGASKEIELDQETKHFLPDGTFLKLTLHQKEYMSFTGDFFSFEHNNKYKPSRNDLGNGIIQTLVTTPFGTGILVQEYKQMNPTSLIDVLLKEITKEEVEYGYKYSEETVRKKVNNITFNGKQAVTTYHGIEWTRNVLSYGKKDKGIIIVTSIEKTNFKTDRNLIERFWESIELKENLK